MQPCTTTTTPVLLGTCPAWCHLVLFCFCLHPVHSHPMAEASSLAKPPSLGTRLLSPASHGLSAPLSLGFNCQSRSLLGMYQKRHSQGYHLPRRVGRGRGQQSTALSPAAALHQAREKEGHQACWAGCGLGWSRGKAPLIPFLF